MPSLADRTIAALRSTHDELAQLVPSLSDAQLAGPSGAADWTLAQVFSHLGSGAELTLGGLRAAIGGTDAPAQAFNEAVWDQWDRRSPRARADEFVIHDARLLEALERLSADQRDLLEMKLGFLPAPLPLVSALGLRLNEAAQHGWDVRVGLDPAATIGADAADALVDHFTGDLGFLLGFTSKADQLSEPAIVVVDGAAAALVIEDVVRLSRDLAGATATMHGSAEALVRLLSGRLGAPYTPDGVEVTGNVTLDDLRRVFPGY